MKIIVLRDKGSHLSVRVSRRRLVAGASLIATLCLSAVVWVSVNMQPNEVDSQVVAQWRAKLESQRDAMQIIEQKSLAQSAAVGRQLAQMQARLLRMEAIGAHMAEAADLQDGEFDFSTLPAQGGPVEGGQTALQFDDLALELDRLSSAIKRREFELDVLDDVLVNEEIQTASVVQGRPVKWGWLSSQFGQRVDPITGKTAWHSGVDFAGRDGSDVIAVASGVVTFAGKRSGYGKLVEISHANGYVTRYAHHKELMVETGEVVKKGEPIGKMGSSGRSTGPHVHFEVLKNGRTVDPASYVTRRS
ncbi:MAG: M23 family metallopeptidase [bacterium]